jgi:PAS domain S-box-containing protein
MGGVASILRSRDERPAPWEPRLDGVDARVVDPKASNGLSGELNGSTCVVVDGSRPDAIQRVRLARRADPAVQAVIVAEGEDRLRIGREILFAPGLGEVWIVEASQLDAGLLARAGDVTHQRRRHARTRVQVEHALSRLEPLATRRAIVSDAYLASLLDASPDPILSVDAEGRVLSWNPGAEHVLGHSRDRAIGRPLAELLGVQEVEVAPVPTGTVSRSEIVFRRSSGEEGVGELIVVPVEAAGHRVFAVVLHDVTEERRSRELLESQAAELEAQTVEMEIQATSLEEHTRQLELVNEELRERTEEMERAASARSRFYASMSHELRTPLNAILGYNDLVLAELYGPVPEQQRQAIQRAHRAAKHLLELINDVLDLAKIEAGRIELQIETVCFPDLLEDLLDTVSSLASQFGAEIRIEGEGAHCIASDPRRLRQILLNLFSNAVKFGREETITARWRATPEGGLEIDVIDRGPGIGAEHIERIFEEFTQLESTPEGGTGLGLPISRRLALHLGGSLTAISTPGEGSTFRLTLPKEAPVP